MCTWLIYPRGEGSLLGSIGFSVNQHTVQFGYCLAHDGWENGSATEVSRAMVATILANPTIWRIQARCHVDHAMSVRVLEKAGLKLEGTWRWYSVLPNLTEQPQDLLLYARIRNH